MAFSSNNTRAFAVPHIEEYPRRVRAYFGGECVVDTRAAKLVWETKPYPHYFFNGQDLPKKGLKVVDETAEKAVYDIDIGGKKAQGNLTLYRSGDLKGLFTIAYESMDHWFEEDEEVFGHAKDPYKRIDVLQSSRHVRVEINGVEVANTRAPRFLYETKMPIRTYIPKIDCHLELLEVSDLTTECPYKGEANYYHVRVPRTQEKVENIVWWYKTPLLEVAPIKGYLAFYDEEVDLWVDGQKQPRPVRVRD